MYVVQEFVFESDPFVDSTSAEDPPTDNDPELLDLMKLTSGNDHCSQNCYISEDLSTCLEMDDDNWEKDFFAELGPHTSKQTSTEDIQHEESDDDDKDGPPPPALKIKSYTEAFSALEDVSLFFRKQRTYVRSY